MKSVLFFASDYKIGLAALLTDQLLSLCEEGVPVYAVAGENEQEPGLSDKLAEKAVTIERIPGLDAHARFLHLAARIERIVKEQNIDIVHVQNNWQLAIVAYVKNKLRFRKKLKVVYTIHGFRNNNARKAVVAQIVIGTALFLFADRVLCMTQYLKSKFRLLSYKIRILPLGINDGFYISEFDKPDVADLKLIFPAQFRQGKNQDVIIRALHAYIKRTGRYNIHLTLPGGGERMEQMQQLARDLNVSEHVSFPGLLPKQQIKDAYIAHNIAVIASDSETFGQSIVEPYVLGRCVISTPVGIAPEIIKAGESGYLFDTEDELTDILVSLSESPELLQTIARNNFKSRDAFRWSNISQKYISHLDIE